MTDAHAKRKALLRARLRERGLEPGAPSELAQSPTFESRSLTPNQRRIWSLHQLNPAGGEYNASLVLSLCGTLDRTRLKKALNECCRRHQVLRSSFVESASGLLQTPMDSYDIPLRELASDEENLADLLKIESQRPFELNAEPLLRGFLVQHAEDQHTLLLVSHQLAVDFPSWGLMLKEITAHYEGQALPELPLQYGDYAQQRKPQPSVSLEHWTKVFEPPLSPLELVSGQAVQTPGPYPAAHHGFSVRSAVTDRLREISKAEGVSLFTTLLSAFSALLSELGDHPDILLFTPMDGRDRPELKAVIGPFTKHLPLRVGLPPELTFLQLLSRVNSALTAALQHQDVALEDLEPLIQAASTRPAVSPFQNRFLLIEEPLTSSQSGNLTLEPRYSGFPVAKFDLSLTIVVRGDELKAELEFKEGVFEEAFVHTLAENFGQLLERLAFSPSRTLSQITKGLQREGPSHQYDHLLKLLSHQVAEMLAPQETDVHVPLQVPLYELGFHSLMAVELCRRLSQALKLELPATFVLDHPTVASMARFLSRGRKESKAPDRAPVLDEPIAVVAMACRAPGGIEDPEGYWRVLEQGRDVIEPIPSRWNTGAEMAVQEGGFLQEVEGFDAEFFGISPREAVAMDPQQRLSLEVAWEALERGLLDPTKLAESNTGVYLGTQGCDYPWSEDEDTIGYQSTGHASSVLSGRVSYLLDLQGPALTVDTACSSSLVALHLACQGLRLGECDLALAGGVQVISTPGTFRETARQGVMAPDGRCKAFSQSADGAGWAEGVGIVLLKRQSEAESAGDHILCLLRGSAVNQDGRSQGLTAPNGPSQERVIHRALGAARLTPGEIDAVEAHGTGTSLGDPIEAGALSKVFGKRQRPLWIGSSKSNIGHTQAAAGVLGVIKLILSLRYETLPRTLHADEPSPHIGWNQSSLELLQVAQPWPRGSEHIRRAGVSSFGISGTNAHLVLEEAPRQARPRELPVPRVLPLILSGKTTAALRANALRLADFLQGRPIPHVDLAYSLANHRTLFEHRLTLLVEAADSEAGYPALRAALGGLEGSLPPMAHLASAKGKTGGLAILFSGQGSQRKGMGLGLYRQPGLEVFTQAFDEVIAVCDAQLNISLKSVLESGVGLNQTQFTQPALFALETALYRQWQAWGLQPDVLLGHSVGELVAAHVAGVMSLDDASRLVCARGSLMAELAIPGGAMASIEASETEVQYGISKLPDHLKGVVTVAAQNTARQTVVSGDEQAVRKLAESFKAQERRVKSLRVSHAFHSSHLDPMLDPFLEIASQVRYTDPGLPIISALTGRVADIDRGDLVTPEYWVRQVRHTVRFAEGLKIAADQVGIDSYLECGPQGALSVLVSGIPSLRPDQSECEALMSAAGALHAHQQKLDWQAFYQPLNARAVRLPTYAFQRRPYWIEADSRGTVSPQLLRCHWEPFESDLRSRPLENEHPVLDLRDPPSPPVELATELLRKLQGWTLEPQGLIVVTRPDDLAGAGVRGLCRSLQRERPEIQLRLVQAPPGQELDLQALGPIPEALNQNGRWYAPRFLPWTPESRESSLKKSLAQTDGTVLVSGASGGLGQVLSHHLVVQHGVKHLLLLSRSGCPPGLRRQLLEAGAESVSWKTCDVSQKEDLTRLLKELHPEHPLTAVFHLAGVLRDALFANQTPEGLSEVFAGKVQGALHLHQLTRGLNSVTHFVLFSSLAGVLGAAGQANYAAANSCLDCLAQRRRAAGLPGVSIAWGPWSQIGMMANASRNQSIKGFSLASGLSLLDKALNSTEPLLLAVPHRDIEGEESPLSATPLTQRLTELDPKARLSWLTERVREEAARVLGLSRPQEVPAEEPLQTLGLDSLMAVELRNRLMKLVEQRLPTTVAFDYPSPRALANFLDQSLLPDTKKWTLAELQRKFSSLSLEQLHTSGLARRIMELPEEQSPALSPSPGLPHPDEEPEKFLEIAEQLLFDGSTGPSH